LKERVAAADKTDQPKRPMTPVTAIEVGPDYCIVARIQPGSGGSVEISCARRFGPDRIAGDELTLTLRQLRKSEKLPAVARVVNWTTDDVLELIAAAGFRIELTLTPPQALAQLSALRPSRSPIAWVAVNRRGAAVSIARGPHVLFARVFKWTVGTVQGGGRESAQLLHCLLVSQLGPELRRGIDVVRARHGMPVEGVLTCGSLPELRSLSGLLVEELGLEVDTLDGTHGLAQPGSAAADRLGSAGAALRLVSGAALAPPDRKQHPMAPLMRTAALAALLAAVSFLAVSGRLWLTAKAAPQAAISGATTPGNR
jgi:hypothetical protein